MHNTASVSRSQLHYEKQIKRFFFFGLLIAHVSLRIEEHIFTKNVPFSEHLLTEHLVLVPVPVLAKAEASNVTLI